MSNVPVLYGPDARPVPAGLAQSIRDAAAPRRGFSAGLGGGTQGYVFPYDAAAYTGPEMGEWLPSIRSPDGEINQYRDRIVARGRDLYRNEGFASGAIATILDATIGASYRLIAKPDYRRLQLFDKAFDVEWAREFRLVAEALWRDFAEDLGHYNDVEQQLTVAQQFRLCLGHKLIDGESLLVRYWLPELVGVGGAQYATAFLGVDPDRLSNPYQGPDTEFMRGGVEITRRGAPVAYHIRAAEPNDYYNALESMTWERVPRVEGDGFARVIHDYDRDRFGQHRGVSVFAPVIQRLKMLARYYGVKLQAATIESIFGTYITSPYDAEMVQEALTASDDRVNAASYQAIRSAFHDKAKLQLNNARLAMLAPGEKIENVNGNQSSSEFSPFAQEMHRCTAAALGTSETEIHKDLGSVNYSSLRGGIVLAERMYVRRYTNFNLNTANPTYAALMHEQMERKLLPLPRNAPSFMEARTAYSRCRWLGAATGWVDPVAERQGVVLGLDAALSTLEEECAKQGLDYEEVLEQRAYELGLMRAHNIPPPKWFGEKVSATEVIQKPQAA
ncbi:MAG: phage portal protein [Phenylobacterium sp.]|nr:phage portal protein [Phenylobacterium sp.]